MKNKIWAIVTLLLCGSLNAKPRTIKSMKSFDRVLNKEFFVVAMLYNKSKEARRDKEYQGKINRLDRMFSSAAAARVDFKQADVAFARIDITDRDLEDLMYRYGIKNIPTFLLFKDGKIIVEPTTQKPAMLQGFVSREDILKYIDKYLKKDITEEAREWRKRRRERSYYGGYWGGFYPYGYWPNSYYYPSYYGYRPRFGFGLYI